VMGYDHVQRLREKQTRVVVGLMSGTSADGVTAAISEITGTGVDAEVRLVAHRTYPYPAAVRERLFKLFKDGASGLSEASELNMLIGHLFAEAADGIIVEAGLDPGEIDLVGSHGQTVWHQPRLKEAAGHLYRSTTQIGEPAVIAARTGLPVVADFRKADIAAGGEGAPLTPYLDYVLHRSPTASRVLQNIGGIANLTYMPAGCGFADVVAFDTGPGNMIIDAAAGRYAGLSHDVDGALARSGKPNNALLDELLRHPYYGRRPPKSTGREDFGEQYASEVFSRADTHGLSHVDVVATVTELTVESIARAYEDHLPGPVDEVYISGGGSNNAYLVERLRRRLSAPVHDYSRLGYPSEAKEALLMALLANEHIMGTPCNVPAATGAVRRVVLGSLTLP
jgi:anhydro-N-acetylmuramic acid kinase